MLRDLNNASDRYIGPTNCGVIGSSAPSTGVGGPSPINLLVQANPALATEEIRCKITRFPEFGTIVMDDDSSAVYTRTSSTEGSDYIEYQPYVNGSPYGPVLRANLVVGVTGVLKTFLLGNLNYMRNKGY